MSISRTLERRLITAAVLLPLVVAGVLGLPTVVLGLILAGALGLGAWEWAALCGWHGPRERVWYVAATGLALGLSRWVPAHWVLAATLLWWCVALVWVARYPRSPAGTGPVTVGIAGMWVLVPPWTALTELHRWGHGPALVLFLLVMIWLADSVAFFAGRRWGRVRLAPRASPGKTREGLWGALGATAVLSLVGPRLLPAALPAALLPFLLICLVTVLTSVLGDLFESVIKRQAGVKDSGKLLPGHGGILDRIDSLTAAAPVFAAGLWWLGRAA